MFSEHDIDLEDALLQTMGLTNFKERCLESEYLNKKRCKELLEDV